MDVYRRAIELSQQYINGTRKATCVDILAGPNPAVLASLVTRNLARIGGFDEADTFIRILESVVENEPKPKSRVEYEEVPIRACDRPML